MKVPSIDGVKKASTSIMAKKIDRNDDRKDELKDDRKIWLRNLKKLYITSIFLFSRHDDHNMSLIWSKPLKIPDI